MTVARGLIVLAMLAAVGVAVVAVRAETAKAANRVQRLHQSEVDLKQRLWSQEMELAQLRCPDEIRRRAQSLGLSVVPPVKDEKPKKPARGGAHD